MAKKKNIQLGIDLQVQNYESAIKSLQEIEKQGGSVGKAATKLRQELEQTRNSIIALGSTTTPQELKKFIKINGDLADSLGDVGKELKVTQEQVNQISKQYKEAQQSVTDYTKKLEEAKKREQDLQKAQKKKPDIVQSKLNDPTNAALADKVKGRKDAQGKWKRINELADAGDADAKRFRDEVNAAHAAQTKALKDVQTEIKGYEAEIKKATAAAEEHKKTLEDLKQQHSVYSKIRKSAEEAADSINENNEALIRTRDAAIKAGEGQIKVAKATDETSSSFTKAAKSVFNYTILYQGLKKVLRESVRTIKEMDDAITGMTVVTNLSREEAWAQVDAFKEIAKSTSSTMTEIAGLTTEYLKQGRAMKDAKILAEETAKSAKIAGISTAEAVQYMTSAINGFNLAASDATRVSDVFANLAAASATDFEDLAIAVSKVSAQANLAGMSLEYTTALLAKGIETTQEAPESIGTALKTIVARMRELSSYGSVLEDGGSVNKVERALASAGIELRDVNGEFRDLEDIFSELGPKWDYLNTMQQQAIAQAVAGTRQQSRFVAIMQDWGRTQELIAEANASQGASAAQYYEYSKGIEAALTRLKTSWEGFVQGFANNKLIVGAVNVATKFIEKLNEMPSFLKTSLMLYLGIVGINKLRENHEIKMKAYRQMALSDEEKAEMAKKKGLEAVLSEKEALNRKKRELEAIKALQKELTSELQNQASVRELAAKNQLNKIEEEIALRKKEGKSTLLLEKEKEKVVQQIEDMRKARAEERKKLEQEIIELEKRKTANSQWIERDKKQKDTASKNADIDKDIAKLEKAKSGASEAEIANIDAEIAKLKKEKETLNKEFENYIQNGLSGYDNAIAELENRSKQLQKDLQDESLSSEERAKKEKELADTESQAKALKTEQANFKNSKFSTADIDLEDANTKIENQQTEKQARINVNKTADELALDDKIDKQTAVVNSTAEGSQERIDAEAELNRLKEERNILIEKNNASESRGVELAFEKTERLAKEITDEEEKLRLKQEQIALEEKQLQEGDLADAQKIETEGEAAKQRLADKGYSVDSPDAFAEEKGLNLEEDADDIAALERLEQLRLKQEEINNLKLEAKSIEDGIAAKQNEILNFSTQNGLATQHELSLEEQLNELEIARRDAELAIQEATKYHMDATEQSMYNENQARIEGLELEQEILKKKKQQLELAIAKAKAEGKDTSKQEKALKKMNREMVKNEKTINKLKSKNKKLEDGSYNVYSKMADLIGSKIGVNLKEMGDNLKTAWDFAKTLYTDLGKIVLQLIARKKVEKETTKEIEQQVSSTTVGTTADTASLGINKLQEEVEEDTTEEVQKQHTTGLAGLLLEKAQLLFAKLTGKEEKKETTEDTIQVGLEAGEAVAEAGEQGAAQNYAGMAIGIAGAVAALALAGIGAAISLGSAGGASNASKEDKVAAKQNANYEMKKSNANANKALDEYTALRDKAVRTAEEEQRMEELESEMQEMDEKFAGLKGDALVKAVRGRVAAQEVAIEDNIQDSFDIALTMTDISDSNVARQAIADKIINSQDKLIESNAALVDATDEEIQAIKNNANDMATQLSQKVDWDKAFGTENKNIWGKGDGTYSMAKDYTGWDYAAQAIGSVLLGPLLGPWGVIGGLTSINSMIAEEKEALAQQNAMAEAISKFETASTQMAIEMEMAEDDLASQINAFNKSMEDVEKSLNGVSKEFKDSALSIVEAQYGTTAYVANLAKLNPNDNIIDRITSIQKKTNGTISESALLTMSDAIVGSALESKNQLEAYKNQGSFGKSAEGWLGFSGGKQEQDLSSIAKNLGLPANASVNEIKAKLASQIKRNSDGTLAVDSDGNYKFKDVGNGFTGNNKDLTEIFNNLSDFAEEIGSLADLSQGAIEALDDWNDAILDAGELLTNTFRTIDEQLLSTEELATADENTKETHNAGYVFANAALEASKKIQKSGEQAIADLERSKSKLDKTSDNYQSELKAINDSIAQVQNDMNTNSANMLSKAQEAIGYLDDAGWTNRVEASNSRRERLQEIKDAIISGDELEVEQIDLLYDEILPSLQELDPTMTASKFSNILDGKTQHTIKLIADYLGDYLAKEEASLQNTVGWNRRMKEFTANELAGDPDFKRFIKNGVIDRAAVESHLDKLIDEGKESPEWMSKYQEYLALESEYEASKDKMDIVLKALETEGKLTADEIELANLRAAVDSIKEDSSKHRLSILEEELRYNDLLHEGLLQELHDQKQLIDYNLSAHGSSFDEMFEIVNGQVFIQQDAYDKLSDLGKEYVTTILDGLKEIAQEEHDTRQTIVDGHEEELKEIISLQDEFIDAYKNKLEEEQEAIEETLDKRKELYQEYFDWLNSQEDEDERDNDIETLRQRVANLSGATDAASLKAYKDAVEELEDLEKEAIQSEQEKIQEQILNNLDKQSEQTAEYYDKQLENSSEIIDILKTMASNDLLELLKLQDDYENQTSEKQLELDEKYSQILDGWYKTNSALSSYNDYVANGINSDFVPETKEIVQETAEPDITPDVVIEEEEPTIDLSSTGTSGAPGMGGLSLSSTATGYWSGGGGGGGGGGVFMMMSDPTNPLSAMMGRYGFSEGGVVDYTGIAEVHGTPAKPEAFLNAEQTALFAQLGEVLVHQSSLGRFSGLSGINSGATLNNNLTIENFDITINADMKEDQDIYNTGQSLADVFFDRIQASGIPVNIKK